MDRIKGSPAAKVTAVILLAASCLVLCGAVLAVGWLESQGAYQGRSTEDVRKTRIERQLQDAGLELLGQMQFISVSAACDSELRFELLDEDGKRLAGNLGGDEEALYTRSLTVEKWYGGLYFTDESEPLSGLSSLSWDYGPETGLSVRPEVTPTPRPVPTVQPGAEIALSDGNGTRDDEQSLPEGTKVRTLRVYWTAANESEAADTELKAYERLFPFRYALIAVGAVSLLLAVLLFVFLMSAAGHHDGTGEVRESFVEKIPFDLLLVLSAAGIGLLVVAIGESFNSSQLALSLVITSLCLLGSGLLALLCLMTLAVRLKLKAFLSSCLVWRVFSRLWKLLGAIVGGAWRLLRGLPTVWRWIPLFGLLLLVDFWLSFSFRRDTDMLAFVMLLRWALLGAAGLYLALCLRRLREGTRAIAAGEEKVEIDTKYLLGDFKAQAEDLTHIREGLSRAVDERMKSERFRTELITNVSHDIKTPLTSIVNYVDLLEKEELPGERARDYVAVLSRQSARLKKLIDDLIEASKAAAGVLPVHAERCELGVLLDQCVGEYGERLQSAGLEPVVLKPEEPVWLLADGRHMWRIFDNLLGNIVKYAQAGTRVYLSLSREGERACLTFRNISREPLNLSGEALLERFVRGDNSRSSEGSGLGLAIAHSLARLQGGDMALTVDGDLFKVTLSFPTAPT